MRGSLTETELRQELEAQEERKTETQGKSLVVDARVEIG